MCKKSLLMMLLLALLVPWAANAQTRETQTFDFEDQTIPSTWTNDATYPWVVTSAKNHTTDGAYCIKSTNNGYNSTTSSIEATFTFNDAGTISFNCLCSCESASSYWDYGIFYIDGTQMDRFLLVTDWVAKSYTVDAGQHTFKWAYTKDSSVGSNDDCLYVDDIVIDLGEVPACPKPTDVAATDPTAYGATISWTGTSDSYILMVAEETVNADYDFETGEIPAAFTNDANYPWTVVENTHSGAYCAKSATGNNSATTALELQIIVPSEATLTFSAKVSSETGYDKAYFSIDGTPEINGISGSGNWIDYSYTLAAGTHTLRWYYTKDSSVASNDDCFYVDDILISSLTAWDESHTASASPYTFTDLNSGTTYQVMVKGVCGSEQSQPSAAVRFTTLELCTKPTDLTVSDVTARTAELNWTSDGTAWEVEVVGEYTTTWNASAIPFTLPDLEPETAYTVRVRTVCDTEVYSGWSTPVSFTTEVACPAPTNLAVSDITAFSANVSWDAFSNVTLRYVANPPMFFQGYVTDAGAMANGADASWTKGASTTWGPSGNYAGGYYLADDFTVNTATALSEIEVYGYQTGSTTESTFTGLYAMILRGNPMEGTVDTIWGDMTTNLMTSTSFTNCYRGSDGTTTAMTRPIMAVTASGLNINLAAGTYWLVYGMTGSLSSGPWAVPYSDPVVGNTGDGLQHTSNGWTALNDDGSGAYGPAMKLSFGDIESFDWTTVNNISTGEYAMTNLDPETLYLVQVRANCGSEGNSNWVSTTFTTLPSCLFPTDLVVSDIEARQAVLAWTENGDATAWEVEVVGNTTTVLNATQNPYTLTGLNPETRYTVRVRSKCSNTDFSEWSLGTSFTTAVACPAPTNLTVSDLTTTSATIGWTSYNETFDVWYREHVSGAGSPASNDFEGGTFGNWTTIDADGDGYDWVLGSACGGIYLTEGGSLAGTGHNASADLATSGSYSNVGGALYPDNYLVSPQITLGGSITFWACGQDASYAAEHFGVAVSTTGNTDAADFTTIQEWTMTAKGRSVENVADRAKPQMRGGNRDQGTWYEYTVDLSAYSGTGYVAIRHFDCSDMFLLNVDDIVIVEPGSGTVIPDWIEANGVANPYTITGLAPETLYDVQVRSNCGGDDGVSTWLIGTFTTLSDCVAPWDLEVANITATTADLSWNGYKDSYDVRYYQLNTIFSADFENQLIPTEMVNDAAYPWTVTDTLTTSGYCIRSGNPGMSSSTSSISITVTFTADGTVEFDAECMGEGTSTAWDKCIFSIDDEAQFTYGAHVSGWNHYSFDVTAGEHTFTWSYSKDSSVDPTGDYFAIDNIFMGSRTLVSTIEGVTSPYTFTGLTPNTEYDVQVSGNGCDNWSEMEDFTTLPQTNVTQTIALVEGTNWFSTYVNITLADLKAALVAALPTGNSTTITIKSKDKNVKFQRGRWVGQLSEADWDLAKMYQIEVNSACEITLEGEPIDPTELTLNIVEGTNWIAFPYNTSMTVTNLFTGFAINNDQVKSKDLNTKYNGRRWAGQLTTLEPGKGYWYVSPSTTVRTFTFPAAAK